MMKKIYEGHSKIFRDGPNLDLFDQFLASTSLPHFELAPSDACGYCGSYKRTGVGPGHSLHIYHLDPPGIALIYENESRPHSPTEYRITLIGRKSDISEVEKIILESAERIKNKLGMGSEE